MIIKKGKLLSLVIALCSFSSTYAQVPLNPLDREEIRQRERQRELDNIEERRTVPGGSSFALPKVGNLPETNCFDVKKLNVLQAPLYPKKQLKILREKWQGKCIDFKAINAILEDVTNWYVKKGYVTTRAYIQPQDISDGSFSVLVVEGKIENYYIQENAKLKRSNIYNAFPGKIGDYLHIRQLEQGLDQINRAPSKNASMQMIPGQEQGGTIVGIANSPAKPWWVSYSLDNDGGENTGNINHRLSAGFDNLFGINDVWSFGFDYSNRKSFWDLFDLFDSPPPNYFYEPDEPNGDSYKYWGSLSIPFKEWTFDISANRYEYFNEVLNPAEMFETSGRSYAVTVGFDRVLHRGQTSKTWLDGSVGIRDTENFVRDVKLEVSDRRETTGNIALNHEITLWQGIFKTRLAYSRGLGWFNASGNVKALYGEEPIEYFFDKFSLDLDYMKPFRIKDNQLVYTGHVYYQHSEDHLPGSERIGLGGKYSVRGFNDAGLYGDRGFYFRNELTWHTKSAHPLYEDILGKLSPYAALDMGGIVKDDDEFAEQGWLAGGALGVKNRENSLLGWDLMVSYPLYKPDWLNEKRDVQFNFNLNLKF